jgi:ATPase subunit of ABC transporter with duplicated ATPase domains
MEEYERLGGYDREVKLDKICRGMNIDEQLRESTFSRLSGGEKTRVNLARILLRDCDILLLDEPTNHLDLISLEWLEKFLKVFSGTVIVISHDRIFLDRVVTRIIEIENGKANFYSGNYSFYVGEKRRRFVLQSQQYKRQQKEIKRIEDRAKWFVVQNRFTTKHHAILSRIDHMDKVEKPNTTRALTGDFDSGGYASKEVVSFDSVCKSFGRKVLLRNASLQILRNDRIALVGANGCGKTTIMKMLMNEELPNSGEIRISVSAKPAYMPQLIEFDNKDDTVLDTLRFIIGTSEEKARSILAGFHFRAADVMKRVGNLSGGEKSRLKLCVLMQNSINFLMLDEPTNHLDIASREWIENALFGFDGTMLFISHDRYFLNRFATKIWSMENGIITQYDCGFDEYLEVLRENADTAETASKKKARTPCHPKTEAKTLPQKTTSVEVLIIETEAELKKLNAEIETDLSSANFSKMNDLYNRKSQLEEKIEELYSEWLGGDA